MQFLYDCAVSMQANNQMRSSRKGNHGAHFCVWLESDATLDGLFAKQIERSHSLKTVSGSKKKKREKTSDSSGTCNSLFSEKWYSKKNLKKRKDRIWGKTILILCTKMRNEAFCVIQKQVCNVHMGDWVFLRLQPFKQMSVKVGSSMKLFLEFFGPYKVLEYIGSIAYRLTYQQFLSIRCFLPKERIWMSIMWYNTICHMFLWLVKSKHDLKPFGRSFVEHHRYLVFGVSCPVG